MRVLICSVTTFSASLVLVYRVKTCLKAKHALQAYSFILKNTIKWSCEHCVLLICVQCNKTEVAVFSCRLCFLRAIPFISLMLIYVVSIQVLKQLIFIFALPDCYQKMVTMEMYYVINIFFTMHLTCFQYTLINNVIWSQCCFCIDLRPLNNNLLTYINCFYSDQVSFENPFSQIVLYQHWLWLNN